GCAPASGGEAAGAAAVLVECGQAVARDARLSTSEQEARAKSYADRAMGLLREAIRRGYRDTKTLTTDSDFEPLRGRPDFQQLIRDLSTTVPPAASTSEKKCPPLSPAGRPCG